MERPQDNDLVLVIVYGHRSLDAMSLLQAASGLCRIVWLIDPADASAAAVAPLLRRSGAVVPALGLPASEAAAQLLPHAPDGIVTFYDTGMRHIAEIAAALELPFNSPATAWSLEDKYAQRTALRAGGLPTPTLLTLPAGVRASDLTQLIGEVDYPVVLKPRRGSGSWHTFRIDSPGEMTEVLSRLESEAPEERIIEGYIPDGVTMPEGFEADYLSVESVAVDGVFTHLALTGRFPLIEPLRETGFFIPATLGPGDAGRVLAVASRALEALDVRWGVTHTELKLTPEGPRVIEINGRIGGGVPEMLGQAAGVDIVRLAMRAGLGLEPGVEEMPATRGVGYRFFYQPPASARRLTGLTGLDALRALPGVDSVSVHHAPGASLDATHGTRTYLFAVVGWAADHAAVVEIDDYLSTHIEATYGE